MSLALGRLGGAKHLAGHEKEVGNAGREFFSLRGDSGGCQDMREGFQGFLGMRRKFRGGAESGSEFIREMEP